MIAFPTGPITRIDGHPIKTATVTVHDEDGQCFIDIESPGGNLGTMIAFVSPNAIAGIVEELTLSGAMRLAAFPCHTTPEGQA